MKNSMILKNTFVQIVLCEILISLAFYLTIPENIVGNCVEFYNKIFPYYYMNTNECGSNFRYVNLYYIAAIVPVVFLIKRYYPRNDWYVAYVPIFVIMNIISAVSFWIWLSGSEAVGMQDNYQLHDRSFFGPTVMLIGSLVWFYLSVLFLVKQKGS